MAGFFDNLMQGLAQAQHNPMFISAMGQMNPDLGRALVQENDMRIQQQEQARVQQEHQNKQQEQQRAMLLQQKLPEILQSIDWNNPQKAQQQLSAIGMSPQEMMSLFNMFSGNERLGLEKEELGLRRQEMGLRQQQLMNELQGGVSPSEAAKIEKELRGEVAKESGEYKTVKSAFKKVQEAAKNPSPANDVALLYGYMKLLDPGSVVRESEYATAQNAAGVPEQVRNIFNKALTGQKLTPEQRKDFVQSAKGQYRTQVQSYKEITDQFKGLAGKYQVNPENVVLFNPEELGSAEEESVPQSFSAPAARGANQYSNEELQAIIRGS